MCLPKGKYPILQNFFSKHRPPKILEEICATKDMSPEFSTLGQAS